MNTRTNYKYAGIFLLLVSLVNMLAYAVNAFGRIDRLAERYTYDTPLWAVEILGRLSLTLLLYIVIFAVAKHKQASRLSLVLIEIWAFIFLVVAAFYYVCNNFYENALQQFRKAAGDKAYVSFYNSTHGFKYASMFICIIFGLVLTGIIMKRTLLPFISGICIVGFMISFGYFDMKTVSVGYWNLGLVISSLLFHLLETVGMFLVSIYMLIMDAIEKRRTEETV